MWPGSRIGIRATVSSGVSSSVPSIPYASAYPRRRSSSNIRSGVVATSMPPTPYQAGRSSVSSPAYSSTEYWARRHIVREPFVWNTRPGACEVDPPVSNSGPWSRTSTSVIPSSAR